MYACMFSACFKSKGWSGNTLQQTREREKECDADIPTLLSLPLKSQGLV